MKQLHIIIIIFILCISLTQFASAQYPIEFRNYLQSKYPACYTSDGAGGWIIDPNCPDIVQEDSLDMNGVFPTSVFIPFPISAVDLQYFTSLKFLNLSNNRISDVPAFPPAIVKLLMKNSHTDGIGPYFTSLPATLQYFNCEGSFIGTLPTFPATLKYLNCASNKLKLMPAFPALLDTIICANQLDFEGRYHTLSDLPALPLGLKYLDCHLDALESLPNLPATLKYLDCSNQSTGGSPLPPGEKRRTLSVLPVLPATLEYFNCNNNRLMKLPTLPASLKYLDCSGNKAIIQNYFNPFSYPGIASIPSLPGNLLSIDCSGNCTSCIPRLPASLTSITLDRDRITCLPNAGNYAVLPAGPTIPLCAVTTNANQCIIDAVIAGRVYYDANSNGIKDAQENYCAKIPVHSSNGLTTYTNDTGYYALNTALGNYTINAIAPSYITVNPANISYSFSTYDTLVNSIIALQPNTVFDSARVQLIPSVARPGFPFSLLVKFENVGTRTVNIDIVVKYNNNQLTFNNASNPAVLHTGNELTLRVNNLQPRLSMSYTAHFTTSVNAFGDTLINYATITANTNTSKDSVITVVTGSFDPNDKSATPLLTPAQVNQGTFINYLVRFQNTGTDTAFNIVITDTLNSQLNPASFELLETSHSTKSTLNGNKIAFELLNILLPDSNVNEPLSHGYIKFRIKPKISVISGSTIPNKAFIYFDFNEPILTNTAVTTIKTIAMTTYNFVGSGNWDNPSNWQGGNVPPAIISSAILININPAPGGTCVLNVPVTINNQSSLIVATGAKLLVMGNLKINNP